MKKIKGLLAACCVCIICLLLLTACSAKLSAPTSFRLNSDTLMLQWNKVRQATGYTIEVGGTTVTTRDNSFSLEGLAPGEYVVRVRAIDHGKVYEESDYAEYKFTREEESGLRYKLVGSSYTLVGIGTASGDVVMDDYYRGRPVTAIGKAALRRCNKITSFVVGKNVTTIEDNAFYNCTELTSITLPEGLTSMGKGVFQSCVKLESVEIPGTLTDLKEYTFSMCKALKQVTIGAGVQTIGQYTFSDCIALESVALPESLVSLGAYAFSACEVLKSVTMGNQLQTIEPYCFYECQLLSSVQLGEGVTTIAEGAFQGCAMTTITVPDSVSVIGPISFRDCEQLAEVNLGSGVTSIGQYAFANTALANDCKDDVLIVGDWIVSAMVPELDQHYYIPENIVGIADFAFSKCDGFLYLYLKNVRYVGVQAFSLCPKLTDVYATDALLTIAEYAFAQCVNLRRVEMGNCLETIRDGAFMNCGRLEESGVLLPKSVQEIGRNAFKNTRLYYQSQTLIIYVGDWVVGVMPNVSLTDAYIREGTRGIANYAFFAAPFADGMLSIPDSVEIIGRGAFYRNAYLASANLPKNLKYVGDYAFYECFNIWFADQGVTVIPDGCEHLGDHAFQGCVSLVSLTVPGSIKHIGEATFKDCVNLGQSVIPAGDGEGSGFLVGDVILLEGIESIGPRAFQGCIGLQEIAVPNSVKEMGTRCFYKCSGLKQVKIGTKLESIQPYSFYDCVSLESIAVPGNVRSIGKYAFRGCTALEQVTLEEGVERVDDYAFVRCESVNTLVLADSVAHIGNFAFRGMTELQSVYLGANVEMIGKLVFYGAKNATIYFEGTQLSDKWELRWNASFTPVVLGAELSADNSYIVSWTATEDGLVNVSQYNPLAAPARAGYTFNGWTTTQGSSDCQYADLTEVPVGTTVYSVWSERIEEEEPVDPENPENPENMDQAEN